MNHQEHIPQALEYLKTLLLAVPVHFFSLQFFPKTVLFISSQSAGMLFTVCICWHGLHHLSTMPGQIQNDSSTSGHSINNGQDMPWGKFHIVSRECSTTRCTKLYVFLHIVTASILTVKYKLQNMQFMCLFFIVYVHFSILSGLQTSTLH